MILLDTHAIVWLASDQDRLTEKGRELIRGNAGQLYVSVVSAWEISILHKRNRLQLPMEPEKYVDCLLRQHDLNEVPLVREVVQRSVRLPDIHNDPIFWFPSSRLGTPVFWKLQLLVRMNSHLQGTLQPKKVTLK